MFHVVRVGAPGFMRLEFGEGWHAQRSLRQSLAMEPRHGGDRVRESVEQAGRGSAPAQAAPHRRRRQGDTRSPRCTFRALRQVRPARVGDPLLPGKGRGCSLPHCSLAQMFAALGLPHTAAHLCGPQVFREITDLPPRRGGSPTLPAMAGSAQHQRHRPEFTEEEVAAIYRTLHQAGLKIILQHHHASRRAIESSFPASMPTACTA